MALRMRGLLAGLWVGACPIDRGTPGVKMILFFMIGLYLFCQFLVNNLSDCSLERSSLDYIRLLRLVITPSELRGKNDSKQ